MKKTKTIKNMKKCCFTGHRNISYEKYKEITDGLKKIIEKLIDEGYNYFISGGALGFDTLSAQTVLNLKAIKDNIFLEIAIPCPEQSKNFTKSQKEIYDDIISKADKTVYVSDRYTSYCMAKRNRYMVDNSNCVVAYLTTPCGGTFNTVNYAESLNKKIIYVGR